MPTSVKRLLVGRPLSSKEQEHQRISKLIGLAVFSSDALSSTAYATEEILFVTAVGTSSLDKGLSVLVPIGLAVGALLAIVVTSYRQTIFAYPSGGGSYIVSRENLGVYPSLVAGAALLIDYSLTVAVSVSAGVAAIVSMPSLRGLAGDRVPLGLLLIAIITLANLRGLRESGRLFALPTYAYIVTFAVLVALGLVRVFFGHIAKVPLDPRAGIRATGGSLSLFLVLKGFSSGAVALTGTEAISNGVPAFRKPEAKNAAMTLLWMGCILGTLFFGSAVLAHHVHPYPSHDETVVSQMGRVVFGGGPIYVLLQVATAAILTLAANTAYADFPRLSSIIARDGYLPHQFANRGDRLVFSNGIVFLAVFAGVLIVAFGGKTDSLIPLYAVGVFTAFTLSQAGMVRHHLREREPSWKRGVVINGVGSAATFVVLLIIAVTKFAGGAWLPLVIMPMLIALFMGIKRHYRRVEHVLEVSPDDCQPEEVHHTVVLLVRRVHRGVVKALNYGKSVRPDHFVAVFVAYEDDDREELEREWAELGFDVPLDVVESPYRELIDPLQKYLDDLDARWGNDTITVLIPEFVVDKWYEHLLHNQDALALKVALLRRPNTIVTSIPYHEKVAVAEVEGNGQADTEETSGADSDAPVTSS